MEANNPTLVKISEVFSSVQGEGRYTGHPAIFIRFAGCSVGCHFCDTKQAQKCEPEWQLQTASLKEYSEQAKAESPYWRQCTVQEVYEYVGDLIEQSSNDKAKRIQMVVITGGEPFEQAEALGELCVKLPYLSHKEHGVTDYLQVCIETSGTVPYADGMEEPSSDNTVQSVLMHTHSSEYCFLTVSPKHKPVLLEYLFAASQLKFLVGHKPELDIEIPTEVFKHISGRTEGICFQPIWDDNNPENNKLAIQRAIKKACIYGGTVSTQTHKFLGIR